MRFTNKIYEDKYGSTGMTTLKKEHISFKDDKIYIDCQPTGDEGKELYKKTTDIGAESRQQGIELLNKLMNSGSVQFILAIAVGMLVLGLGKRAFTRS